MIWGYHYFRKHPYRIYRIERFYPQRTYVSLRIKSICMIDTLDVLVQAIDFGKVVSAMWMWPTKWTHEIMRLLMIQQTEVDTEMGKSEPIVDSPLQALSPSSEVNQLRCSKDNSARFIVKCTCHQLTQLTQFISFERSNSIWRSRHWTMWKRWKI